MLLTSKILAKKLEMIRSVKILCSATKSQETYHFVQRFGSTKKVLKRNSCSQHIHKSKKHQFSYERKYFE